MLAKPEKVCYSCFYRNEHIRGVIMHPDANKLIGKSIQKVESTKRGIVASVQNGWLADSTIIVFEDGYKGMYQNKDIPELIKSGKHNHNCE